MWKSRDLLNWIKEIVSKILIVFETLFKYMFRCEIEINTRTEQLISQLEMSKMKLLNDLNLSCQKLVEELQILSLSKAEDSNEKFHDLLETTNIKFAVATDFVDFSSCIHVSSKDPILDTWWCRVTGSWPTPLYPPTLFSFLHRSFLSVPFPNFSLLLSAMEGKKIILNG